MSVLKIFYRLNDQKHLQKIISGLSPNLFASIGTVHMVGIKLSKAIHSRQVTKKDTLKKTVWSHEYKYHLPVFILSFVRCLCSFCVSVRVC